MPARVRPEHIMLAIIHDFEVCCLLEDGSRICLRKLERRVRGGSGLACALAVVPTRLSFPWEVLYGRRQHQHTQGSSRVKLAILHAGLELRRLQCVQAAVRLLRMQSGRVMRQLLGWCARVPVECRWVQVGAPPATTYSGACCLPCCRPALHYS